MFPIVVRGSSVCLAAELHGLRFWLHSVRRARIVNARALHGLYHLA
jgi:hypothetical protein